MLKLRSLGRRAASPTAIGILVILIVFLYGFALFSFSAKYGQFDAFVFSGSFVNGVYSEDNMVNFYVDTIGNDAVKKINSNEDIKGDFIKYFREELAKYKTTDGKAFVVKELSQIDSQLIPENVEVGNDEISLKLNLKYNEKVLYDNTPGFSIMEVNYVYEKKFVFVTNFS